MNDKTTEEILSKMSADVRNVALDYAAGMAVGIAAARGQLDLGREISAAILRLKSSEKDPQISDAQPAL